MVVAHIAHPDSAHRRYHLDGTDIREQLTKRKKCDARHYDDTTRCAQPARTLPNDVSTRTGVGRFLRNRTVSHRRAASERETFISAGHDHDESMRISFVNASARVDPSRARRIDVVVAPTREKGM